MIRISLFILAFLGLTVAASAQEKPAPRTAVGLEQDVLPYLTGGYFAGVWIGKSHTRVRALTARVHKPDIFVPEGFTNNRVTAYALVVDYFLKENWKGWWLGTGPTYWRSSIQSESRWSTVHFENILLNGSIGYNFPLPHNLYVSPWAGMHILVAGKRHLTVDGKDYTAPLFNPEASVKVGWRFR